MLNHVERATGQYSRHGIYNQNAERRYQKCAGVNKAHLRQAVPGADIEQRQAHPRGDAGKRRHGDMRERSRSQTDKQKQKNRMHNIRNTGGSPATHVGHAARRDSYAHGRAEHTRGKVGYTIGAEFGVGIGALLMLVPSSEMVNR